MRCLSKAVFLLSLVYGVCLAAGCSEKSTGPRNNPPPMPSGKHLWSKRLGDESIQSISAPAVDASGNVIITGGFRGAVDFGGGVLTSAGMVDIYIVKFTP